jgi:multisubunit Na+/H+ antiporter MnhG subunit
MVRDVATIVLLVAGLAVQVLAVLGVALVRDALDRVHFLAPSTLATALLAAAVVVRESFSLIGISALLLAGFMAFGGPVLSHVTARAIHQAHRADP